MAPGHGAHRGRVRAAGDALFSLAPWKKAAELGQKRELAAVSGGGAAPLLRLLLACDLYFEKCQGCDGAAVLLLLRRSPDTVPPWRCDDRGFPALPSVTSIQTALSLGGVCFSELRACQRDLLASVRLLLSYTVHLLFAPMAKIKAAFPSRRSA